MRTAAAELVERTSVKQHLVPATSLVRRRHGRLTLGAAHAIAGSLGHPSKMPGYSYGLDARRCHRGRTMAQVAGSICSGCFALSAVSTARAVAISSLRRWIPG